MNKPVITVENLSKRYRIGLREKKYRTFREVLKDGITAPLRNLARLRRLTRFDDENAKEEDVIWALRDISFEVPQGQVLGIIGRNGAGKTTLLKILSNITEPTRGCAFIQGRVGSLLEVGTGFHPELTGRENVFLNGAILGMKKAEIGRKLDEIVAFAEIEKFIDTPVKRYSSGMFVRLAFAVAAHLEPEILLVDEVLAVGDIAFQKKCLGKMGHVAAEGRTVLFVSHNMLAIRALCNRAILLDEGKLVMDDEPEKVIQEYVSYENMNEAEVVWDDRSSQPGNELIKLVSMRTRDSSGNLTSIFQRDQSIIVEFEFDLARLEENLHIGLDLKTGDGIVLFRSHHTDGAEKDWATLTVGRNILQCVVPANFLKLGRYLISPVIGLHYGQLIVGPDPLLSFTVIEGKPISRFWIIQQGKRGVTAPILHWKHINVKSP
ncbi:MAG: polysaccharide ABC transporter ATP-binding protein [Candidatus Aminicenantaceae bacterium]